MSRRKKRSEKRALENEAAIASAPEIPERWPPAKPRRWMLVLSAICVLAWLTLLVYIGLFYGN